MRICRVTLSDADRSTVPAKAAPNETSEEDSLVDVKLSRHLPARGIRRDVVDRLEQQLLQEQIHAGTILDVVRLQQVVGVLTVEDPERCVVGHVVRHVLRLLDGVTIVFVLRAGRGPHTFLAKASGRLRSVCAAHLIEASCEQVDAFLLQENIAHVNVDVPQRKAIACARRLFHCKHTTNSSRQGEKQGEKRASDLQFSTNSAKFSPHRDVQRQPGGGISYSIPASAQLSDRCGMFQQVAKWESLANDAPNCSSVNVVDVMSTACEQW